ncbi:MAG TPA: hypothetical protein PK149_12185 [Flavobacteriales bacterium]|nr:hypothetical protein [Flavobacteriales bacterium]
MAAELHDVQKTDPMEATNGTLTEPKDPYADLDLSVYLESLKSSVNGYVRTEKQLIKMQLTDRAGSVMAGAVEQIVRLVCMFGVLLFLTIALSLYVGELTNSYPIGFAVGASTYLLIYLIYHVWWSGGGKDRFIIERINDLFGHEPDVH